MAKFNKKKFFGNHSIKRDTFILDGESLSLTELSLEDRGDFSAAYKEGAKHAQAFAVCSCFDDFTMKDMGDVKALSPSVLSDMATAALDLSGLTSSEDEEKN